MYGIWYLILCQNWLVVFGDAVMHFWVKDEEPLSKPFDLDRKYLKVIMQFQIWVQDFIEAVTVSLG